MSISVGIITVSDRCAKGEQEDKSGAVLKELCKDWKLLAYQIVPDEQHQIEQTLKKLADETGCQLIFTTGGTGFAPRDVTPEATRTVIQKEAPGLCEAMRSATLKHTKFAILSRAVAGIRNHTLIINLPGSPKGVEECFAVIRPVLPHALNLLAGNTKHD
jgi:molybdopterin adenylyltransferase